MIMMVLPLAVMLSVAQSASERDPRDLSPHKREQPGAARDGDRQRDRIPQPGTGPHLELQPEAPVEMRLSLSEILQMENICENRCGTHPGLQTTSRGKWKCRNSNCDGKIVPDLVVEQGYVRTGSGSVKWREVFDNIDVTDKVYFPNRLDFFTRLRQWDGQTSGALGRSRHSGKLPTPHFVTVDNGVATFARGEDSTPIRFRMRDEGGVKLVTMLV